MLGWNCIWATVEIMGIVQSTWTPSRKKYLQKESKKESYFFHRKIPWKHTWATCVKHSWPNSKNVQFDMKIVQFNETTYIWTILFMALLYIIRWEALNSWWEGNRYISVLCLCSSEWLCIMQYLQYFGENEESVTCEKDLE